MILIALILLLVLRYTYSLFPDKFKNHHQYNNNTIEDNDIVIENRKKGSRLWFSGWKPELKVGVNTSTYNFSLDQPGPKGFCTEYSFLPGNTIHFKLDSLIYDQILIKEYELSIFRLGYYNGTGARLIDTLTITNPVEQPKCTFYNVSRMVDCSNWHITTSYKLGTDLITGIYIALPIYKQNNNKDLNSLHGSYIPFVIRDYDDSNRNTSLPIIPNKKKSAKSVISDILFRTSDLTWVAYNLYGRYNLYRGNGMYNFASRAKVISYNRPFNSRISLPSGKYQNFLFGTEFAMLYWLERLGYSVSYASCSDVERWGKTQHLTKYRALFSIGHDEYWTQGLRNAIYGARDAGVNLAFFSGNEFLWKVRWLEEIEDDKSRGLKPKDYKEDGYDLPLMLKESNRIIYSRKETIDGIPPAYPSDWTGTFMDSRFNLKVDPSNALTGQQNVVNAHRADAMTVSAGDAKLRLWRHSQLFDPSTYSNNSVYTTVEGFLGYEWDLYVEDCHRPAGLISFSNTKVEIQGHLLQNHGAEYKGNGTAYHRITMYRHISSDGNKKKSSIVFAVGTVQWSWGLSEEHDGAKMAADKNIQQATINILADMRIQPSSLYNSEKEHKLVRAHHTNDNLPPYSVIENPLSSYTIRANSTITVSGYARDRGGGKVAGVEVSFDNGWTWKLANGRYRWEIIVSTGSNGLPINKCTSSPYTTIKITSGIKRINVISRAIDDSGWIEETLPASNLYNNENGRNNNDNINNTMIDKYLLTKRNFLSIKVL